MYCAVCVFFHAYGKTCTTMCKRATMLLLFLFDPTRNVCNVCIEQHSDSECYYILGRDKADICGHIRRFFGELHPLQINAVCICFYSFECFCVFCGCSKSNEKNILDRLRYGFFSYSQIHIAPDFAKITHFLLSVFGNCQWNYFYGLRYFSMDLQSFQFLKSKWFPYLNLPTYCVIAWNWKKMLVICKNANRCLN